MKKLFLVPALALAAACASDEAPGGGAELNGAVGDTMLAPGTTTGTTNGTTVTSDPVTGGTTVTGTAADPTMGGTAPVTTAP